MSTVDDVLEMNVVRGVRGVDGVVKCVCKTLGGFGVVGVEKFGLCQSCRNRGSVGRVCVCVAAVWFVLVGVFGLLGSGRVVWWYVCVCCESGFFVEMAGPGITLVVDEHLYLLLD